MNNLDYTSLEIQRAINQLNLAVQSVFQSNDMNSARSHISDLLALISDNEIIANIFKPIIDIPYAVSDIEWETLRMHQIGNMKHIPVPNGIINKLKYYYLLFQQVSLYGIQWLEEIGMFRYNLRNSNAIREKLLNEFLSPIHNYIKGDLIALMNEKKNLENQKMVPDSCGVYTQVIDNSQNYGNSIKNQGDFSDVCDINQTINVIGNSEEILNLLKQALDQLDELQNEERQLAKMYLKSMQKGVSSGNIDEEDYKEGKTFFEKLKKNGFKIAGIALQALALIPAILV